ncbi:MAG: OsmC family protein [Elusimicrobiaceae bacterium]|nr:OsmC family protein [Elusimicrobiaceae bacterium]
MTKILSTYIGDGKTTLTHEPTGAQIQTDLPPDNGGKGRLFSPTDLLASAFASCILTIMGKMAERNGEKLEGACIEIEKVMAQNPRRIGEFILHITFPPYFTPSQKQRYLGAVQACPVHQTLREDIKITIHTD